MIEAVRLTLLTLLVMSLSLLPTQNVDAGDKSWKKAEKSRKYLPGRQLDRRVRAVIGDDATDTLRDIYRQGVEQATTAAKVTVPPVLPERDRTQVNPAQNAHDDVRQTQVEQVDNARAAAIRSDEAAFARAVDALFAEALDADPARPAPLR